MAFKNLEVFNTFTIKKFEIKIRERKVMYFQKTKFIAFLF